MGVGNPVLLDSPARNSCSSNDTRTSDALIFVPTYNEAEVISPLLDRLLGLPVCCDILIVDDQSTDNTIELIKARAKVDCRVRLIVRSGKLGIGSAHKLGWLYARRQGYTRLVCLDADFSHDPADVPRLLAALDQGADVAIGSRFAPGARLDYMGWRLFLSTNANRFARLLLRLPLTEYTTSFRAVRLDRVPPGLIEGIGAQGYGFFLNCAVRLAREKLVITELPIHFRDRQGGKSKIPRAELIRGVTNLLLLTMCRAPGKRSALPVVACPTCGGRYRVTRSRGEILCLECLGADRPLSNMTQEHKGSKNPAPLQT